MGAIALLLAQALCVTAIAAGFSFGLCRLMMKTGVVDAPDEDRKHQAAPVPRLGGAAILATLVLLAPVTLITLAPQSTVTPDIDMLAALGVIVVTSAAIGLWDDISKAPTRLKLAMLLAASFGAAAFGLQADTVQVPWGETRLPLVLVLGSAAWLLVMTNAVNFMDGSNGLAVGSLAIMFAGLAAIGTATGHLALSLGWFAVIGACIGFLVLNLRGEIFAGDAGALGLGSLFAGLSLASGLDIWTVATLALPFLVDVLMTLVWRARRGQSWLQPHLDHTYQGLLKRGWSHLETAVLYWGLAAACGVAAYVAARAGGAVPFITFCGLLIAGITLWAAPRRAPPAG